MNLMLVLYTTRVWVEKEFYLWCEENDYSKTMKNLIAFMIIRGWVDEEKLVNDERNSRRNRDVSK